MNPYQSYGNIIPKGPRSKTHTINSQLRNVKFQGLKRLI